MHSPTAQAAQDAAGVLVWDLPVRIFHGAFAFCVLVALAISLLGSDDSPTFVWHAIAGLTAGCLAVWRVVWGFVGTRHARFGDFVFGPRETGEYLAGAVTGRGRRYIGHNPGSAVAILALLALVGALAVSGLSLGRGLESVKELHETLAWATLAVIGGHLAGVLLHTWRHRENITAAMLHGHKQAPPEEAISSPRPVAGLGLLVALLAVLGLLAASRGRDGQSLALPGTGLRLQIGDAEQEGGGEAEAEEHADDD